MSFRPHPIRPTRLQRSEPRWRLFSCYREAAMKAVLCLAAALLTVRPAVAHADTPCTGCVVWETRGAAADAVLAAEGPMRGLTVLLGAPVTPGQMDALRARGADVGLVHEIDGEPPEPSADVLRRVSRLLIRSTAAPDPRATAFAIRRLATRARALRPGIEVGVEANPDIVAAVTPYVDFAIAQAGEPRPQGLPVWEKGRTLRVLDAASVSAALTMAANADALPAASAAPETVPRFSSDVEVVARRTLSVEEVIARHQAAAVRQGERIASWVGSGSTIIAFQAPGLAAPMTVTAGTVVFVGPGVHEVEQREVRLNGVAVPIGRDAVPRLPIIEPERVSAAPLALVLDERYRYRLEKPEAVDGHPSYVVVFEPAMSGTALMSGRAWISSEDFGLVRMDAEQTGLRGPIVSSRQRDEYRALDVDGERAWVLRRSETHQSYEGPGHRTPIHRVMTLDTFEANPPDFAARRQAAHGSSSVLLALTDEGFRYLRRDAPPRTAVTPGEAQTEQPSALRTIAGRSTRIWTAAAGLLVDPNIDDPLPFAGLGYLDLDFLGSGSQLNAFAAGPFLQLAWSAPSIGGGRTLVQVRGFASLVEYNDRSFRDGIERYDENVRQRPASAAIDLIRPFGGGWRVRASYEMAHPGLRRGPDTAPAFQTPASPTVHAGRLTLEGEVARWTLSAWASAARRSTWSDWGFEGNPDSSPDARGYERGGAGATRSFVLGPRVAARVDLAAMAGRGLDRFSRFTFDGLENRLHGSPSATVRFDRGVVWRSALSATATRAVRGDLFLDLAVVHDPAQGRDYRAFSGYRSRSYCSGRCANLERPCERARDPLGGSRGHDGFVSEPVSEPAGKARPSLVDRRRRLGSVTAQIIEPGGAIGSCRP